jgi:hypothetical protein
MNTLKHYLRYNSPEYTAFLSKNPKIEEAIKVMLKKVEQSIFKDRIEINILVWSQWTAIDPQIAYSLSNLNKVKAYSSIYFKLVTDLQESHPSEECDLSTL